jgi:methionyl-tRNA formyltransferase
MKKLIFLTPDRAAPLKVLELLSEFDSHQAISLECIVTDNSLHKKLKNILNKEVLFISNDKRNEDQILKAINKKNIDMLLTIQHPWILSEKVINSVEGYAFNNHMAKLPDYRGHHTSIHAILNGENEFSTTLHKMTPVVDSGFKIFEEHFAIDSTDTSWSLQPKMTQSTYTNVLNLLKYIINNKQLPSTKIKSGGNFYAIDSISQLKEIVNIDDRSEIDRKVRAFFHPPHEPAYYKINKKKNYILPEKWFKEFKFLGN